MLASGPKPGGGKLFLNNKLISTIKKKKKGGNSASHCEIILLPNHRDKIFYKTCTSPLPSGGPIFMGYGGTCTSAVLGLPSWQVHRLGNLSWLHANFTNFRSWSWKRGREQSYELLWDDRGLRDNTLNAISWLSFCSAFIVVWLFCFLAKRGWKKRDLSLASFIWNIFLTKRPESFLPSVSLLLLLKGYHEADI